MALASAAVRLAEAKEALHAILIGRGVQSVRDSNGEQVSYSRANVGALRAYIADLQAEVDGSTSPYNTGPIRPRFV